MWDSTAGYKVPIGWDNMNAVTTSASVYTCERLDPGYTGAYYLALNTETVPGMGIVAGMAVSGKLDPITHEPKSGFPFSSRPQVLAGAWQYMAYHTPDQGYVTVYLSKWNAGTSQRDTIAYTRYLLPGMVMSWQDFALPLNYYSTASPDSAMIVLSASGPTPVAYSFLWVDNLRFADSATLGSSIITHNGAELSVYPNPATGFCTVSYYADKPTSILISLYEVSGRIVYKEQIRTNTGTNKLPISLKGLSNGIYFLKVTDESGVKQEKLIIY